MKTYSLRDLAKKKIPMLLEKSSRGSDMLQSGTYLVTSIYEPDVVDILRPKAIRFSGFRKGKNLEGWSDSEDWTLLKEACKLPLNLLVTLNGRFGEEEAHVVGVLENYLKE